MKKAVRRSDHGSETSGRAKGSKGRSWGLGAKGGSWGLGSWLHGLTSYVRGGATGRTSPERDPKPVKQTSPERDQKPIKQTGLFEARVSPNISIPSAGRSANRSLRTEPAAVVGAVAGASAGAGAAFGAAAGVGVAGDGRSWNNSIGAESNSHYSDEGFLKSRKRRPFPPVGGDVVGNGALAVSRRRDFRTSVIGINSLLDDAGVLTSDLDSSRNCRPPRPMASPFLPQFRRNINR